MRATSRRSPISSTASGCGSSTATFATPLPCTTSSLATTSSACCISPPRATSTARSSGRGRSSRRTCIGTLNLLSAARERWRGATDARCFLHVSTDEVYGALSPHGPPFSETTPYAPNSPYAASKAASDHLVRAWHHTYGLPTIITNCSNNYGPWQFPEKLIPLMILNAIEGKRAAGLRRRHASPRLAARAGPLRGAARSARTRRRRRRPTASAATTSRRNLEVVETICDLVDGSSDRAAWHCARADPPRRRSPGPRPPLCDRLPARCSRELGWTPRRTFETRAARKIVHWYLATPRLGRRHPQRRVPAVLRAAVSASGCRRRS